MNKKQVKNSLAIFRDQKGLSTFIVIGIVAALIVLGIVGFVYVNINQFFLGGSEDSRSTPTTNLSQLRWGNGSYKIYYRTQEGLHSIMTDGTNKKIIYSKPVDYLLLDKTRKILVRERGSLSLLDENGQNVKNVFQGPANKWIQDWRLSPDETKVALQITDDNKWKDPKNLITDDIYVVNLQTGQSRQLNIQTELENYRFLDKILWSADSTKVYLDTTKYLTENDGRALYFSYEPLTDKVVKIGDEKSSLSEQEMRGLSNFITNSPAVLTRRDGVTRTYYYSRTSPDGIKTIEVDYEGNIKVNNQNILFWSYDALKGPEHCRYPGWLPDNNHLTIECFGLRIIEVDSKKVAILDDKGHDAQWYGQKFEELYNN